MDRIEFVKQLECKEKMTENFDEIMSLYDIVHIHKNAELHLNNDKPLSLDLTLPSNNIAARVKGSLDRVELTNYNNKYVVETTLDNKIINLKLNKVSG